MGIGGVLSLSGVISLLFFERLLGSSLRYGSYTFYMIYAGVSMIAVGIIALLKSRTKRGDKETENSRPSAELDQ